jgi:dihydropteroate synthase
MGIVNATPDSFFAESRAADPERVVEMALRQIEEGADLIDVGGESTRPPRSEAVPAGVEQRRVVPAIERLAARTNVPISIDTYKAETARAAIGAGASLINDVSGGAFDPAMPATAAALGVPLIVGHLRGTRETMHAPSPYADLLGEVRDELSRRIESFVGAGMPRRSLLVDPGFGFSKRDDQCVELLARLDELHGLGLPLVVGLSRKRFTAAVLERAGLARRGDPAERLEPSLAAAVLAVARGAAVVRTHDVAATRRALAMADAIEHGA